MRVSFSVPLSKPIQIWLWNLLQQLRDNLGCSFGSYSFIIAIGDSNAKSNNCDTTSFEGSKAKTITSKFGLQKIIDEPTHNQGKSATCIDLIFTSKLNLVMDSGIYLSLHQKYQHQIVFATFSLKDHYQPSGKHEVWW